KLARALAVHAEGKLPALGDNLPAVAGDLKTIGSRRFAGRRDEMTGRAVVVFEDRADFILDFNRMRLADVRDGGDARWHHSGEPVELIEIVWALVEQDAAAFAFPCRAPSARGIVAPGAEPARDNPADAADVSQLAALNDLAQLLEHRVGAHLEIDAEFQFR